MMIKQNSYSSYLLSTRYYTHAHTHKQLTLGQHRFELCRSTYTQIFKNLPTQFN